MKKRFKRVYIEITNICNLNCSFCSKSHRQKKEMSIDDFEYILKEVNDYTDFIYLHVKGEPLLHSKLDKILELCDKYHKKVTITTNGTMLKNKLDILVNTNCIRQINISLHSENEKENYLDEIVDCVNILSKKMYVVYRFWTLDDLKLNLKSLNIVDKLNSYYKFSTEIVEKIKNDKSICIGNNIFISKDNLFVWPSLDNNYYNESGYCYGLKDQIGILSDGTVIPCCLDGEGIVDLGNIFDTSFKDIILSDRVSDIIAKFLNRHVCEELCKHCSFKDRF